MAATDVIGLVIDASRQMVSASTGSFRLAVPHPVAGEVGDLAGPGHGDQPTGQAAVVHVASEVSVQAIEAGLRHPDR